MLSFTRRVGEGVLIGRTMIRVVTSTCGKLRLSIDAPDDVAVTREELLTVDSMGNLNHPPFITKNRPTKV